MGESCLLGGCCPLAVPIIHLGATSCYVGGSAVRYLGGLYYGGELSIGRRNIWEGYASSCMGRDQSRILCHAWRKEGLCSYTDKMWGPVPTLLDWKKVYRFFFS